MDSARARVDFLHQGVGVGAFQFGELAPVEHSRRQVVALSGQVFQHVGAGRPGAGLAGLLAARQAHFVEQNLTQLLWRADRKSTPGEPINLVFQRAHPLGKVGGERLQPVAVNQHAARLHLRQHRQQRPVELLVNPNHAVLS